MSCEGSATSGDLRTCVLKTTRRNREVCPPEFHDDVEPGPSSRGVIVVVGIGVGVQAVAISHADTRRTDRVMESFMAVCARALQLVVVFVCMA